MSPRPSEWTPERAEAFRAALTELLKPLKWREVARMLGVTTGTITNWRKGRTQPTPAHEDAVLALADKLRRI